MREQRTSNHIWGQRGHRERPETNVPLLGKQQDYEFNIAKVTEMRNLALLHLSLCVCCYTPSRCLIHLIKFYSHLINHFIKFLNAFTETLQQYSNFFFFSLWTSLLLLAMCVRTSPGDLSVNPPKSQNLQFLAQCKAKL